MPILQPDDQGSHNRYPSVQQGYSGIHIRAWNVLDCGRVSQVRGFLLFMLREKKTLLFVDLCNITIYSILIMYNPKECISVNYFISYATKRWRRAESFMNDVIVDDEILSRFYILIAGRSFSFSFSFEGTLYCTYGISINPNRTYSHLDQSEAYDIS